MKKLIINADDFGADGERNRGILETVAAGMTTSVGILVNGPAFSDAVQSLVEGPFSHVSFGIHINLSEGEPLSRGLSLLTGSDGLFRGKSTAYQLLCRPASRELQREILEEIQAQIYLLKKTGLPISHIDGHQHVHVFPAVRQSVFRAALDFKIPWVRIPDEGQPMPTDTVHPECVAEAKRFSEPAAAARLGLKRTPLRAPDHFRGLFFKGRLSAPLLVELIETLPRGLTELMVHPGHQAASQDGENIFSAFSTADREQELKALLHPSVSAALRRSNVLLTPFPENTS